MAMTPGQVDGLWLWVRRWLERPIWARKARPHIGQAWVGAVVDDPCVSTTFSIKHIKISY